MRVLCVAYSTFKLRPYQKECLDLITKSLGTIRRPVVSLPTGSGKTVLFSSLIPLVKPLSNQGNKTLVLVNRREIAFQTISTINKLQPSLRVGLEMGKNMFRQDPGVDVCVANISSISKDKRLAAFNPKDFKLIIVDEAHHCAADSYQKVLNHFEINKTDPNIYCLGVSATFFRKDKRPLIFDKVVYHRAADVMIDEGHLCDVVLNTVDFQVPEQFKTSKTDNNYLFSSGGCELIVQLWQQNADSCNSTVIFCINTRHVNILVDMFRENGIDARRVVSGMPEDERRDTIEEFRRGEFPVLINCMILTEGTDIPNIDQIILATPIGSTGLAMQMVGRGLRLHPTKASCNIVLFKPFIKYINNLELIPHLRQLGAHVEEKDSFFKTQPDIRCTGSLGTAHQQGGGQLDEVSTDTSVNLMDMFGHKGIKVQDSYAWLRYDNMYFMFPRCEFTRAIRIKKQRGQWVVDRLIKLDSSPMPSKNSFAKFRAFALASCKEFADAYNEASSFIASNYFNQKSYLAINAEWRRGRPSPAQLRMLSVLSPRTLESLDKGVASSLISLKMLGYRLTEDKIQSDLQRSKASTRKSATVAVP